MKNTKYYLGLSDAGWIVFLLATMLMFGGLHPNDDIKSIVFFYSGLLIILLNIPLSIYLIFLAGSKRYFNAIITLFLFCKLILGFWLINTSNI